MIKISHEIEELSLKYIKDNMLANFELNEQIVSKGDWHWYASLQLNKQKITIRTLLVFIVKLNLKGNKKGVMLTGETILLREVKLCVSHIIGDN